MSEQTQRETTPDVPDLMHQGGMSRWLAFPLVFLIRFYQLAISPLLPPSCRFYPSCSAYGLGAVRRFGPIRGTWLAVCRVGRCHPWNPGGVDHVPLRGQDGRPVRHNEADISA